MDCFTCSIKPTQKRLQQEKEKPIQQIVISDQDKMTQCSQPRDCHSTNMTQLDFIWKNKTLKCDPLQICI